MNKKETERQQISRIIIGGLRETIRIHGPITKLLIGSAAKRITNNILRRKHGSTTNSHEMQN